MSVRDEINDYNLRFEALSIPKLLDIKVSGKTVTGTIIDDSYTDIKIPDFITHIARTSLGMTTGKELVRTESVKLGKEVKVIAKNVFSSAINLKEIYGLENVETIGDAAFWGCDSLKSINLANAKKIGNMAFSKCIGLENIEFGTNLVEIGRSAFYGCNKLDSVKLPDGLKVLWVSAFENCDWLRRVEIPQSLFQIHESAFEGCVSLESVTFYGESDTKHYPYIHHYAFKDCYSLREFIVPDYIGMIGRCAFLNCEKLEHIVIGKGVTTIEEEAFVGCKSLKTVHLKSKKIKDISIFGNAEVIRC